MRRRVPNPENALAELALGIAERAKRAWPGDFGNSQYSAWTTTMPQGDFDVGKWPEMLRTLRAWIATRPVSGEVITSRFMERRDRLREAWRDCIKPLVTRDLSSVEWGEVEPFVEVVGEIKPTKSASAVFSSKFCHFLVPAVFPLVDRDFVGIGHRPYEEVFEAMRSSWTSTPPNVRTELVAYLTSRIEASGATPIPGYPYACRITELRFTAIKGR